MNIRIEELFYDLVYVMVLTLFLVQGFFYVHQFTFKRIVHNFLLFLQIFLSSQIRYFQNPKCLFTIVFLLAAPILQNLLRPFGFDFGHYLQTICQARLSEFFEKLVRNKFGKKQNDVCIFVEIGGIEGFGQHGAFDRSFLRELNGLTRKNNFEGFENLSPLVCNLLGSISILEVSTFLWSKVVTLVHLIFQPFNSHFLPEFNHLHWQLATQRTEVYLTGVLKDRLHSHNRLHPDIPAILQSELLADRPNSHILAVSYKNCALTRTDKYGAV